MAVKNYFSIGHLTIAQSLDGERVDYLADRLGTVLKGVAENGSVCAEFEFTPFGRELMATGSYDTIALRWIGCYGYLLSGLEISDTYVRWRFYSTDSSTWTTPDPILKQSNGYNYVDGNPSTLIDLWGLDALTVRFSAFIHKKLNDPVVGPWFPEPWFFWTNSNMWFKGDNRGFGDAGSDRLTVLVGIDSCAVGSSDPWHKVVPGVSHRGYRVGDKIVQTAQASPSAKVQHKKSHSGPGQKPCRSKAKVQAAAGYPFIFASPDILSHMEVTFTVLHRRFVQIDVCVQHTLFPFFEVVTHAPSLFSRRLIYTYDHSFSGPNPALLSLVSDWRCAGAGYVVPTELCCTNDGTGCV